MPVIIIAKFPLPRGLIRFQKSLSLLIVANFKIFTSITKKRIKMWKKCNNYDNNEKYAILVSKLLSVNSI